MDFKVIEDLFNKGITIGSAESLTGGLFASNLTSIQGISRIFKGSIVSYSNEVKNKVIGVKEETLKEFGAVSSECAYEMALNTAKILNVDLCVSFTGNAGPATLENKDCGLVYIGVYYKGEVNVYENHFEGSRNQIRNKCIDQAFEYIKKII